MQEATLMYRLRISVIEFGFLIIEKYFRIYSFVFWRKDWIFIALNLESSKQILIIYTSIY